MRLTIDEKEYERAVDKALDLIEQFRVSEGVPNSVALASLLLTAGAFVGLNSYACDELAEAVWGELCSDDARHLFMTGYRTMLHVRVRKQTPGEA